MEKLSTGHDKPTLVPEWEREGSSWKDVFGEGRCNRENRNKQVILQINLLHPKQDHLWAVLAFVQHKHKHPVSALGFNHFLFLISIAETGENF